VSDKLRFHFDARVPMRDGVELSADVYLPAADEPQPAMLERTPYDNANADMIENAAFFASHGYAFVAQDVRGRGDSEGRFIPFEGEAEDGYDTIEWIAKQSWCNGKVAMMGASYAAFVQWVAAREQPPHLITIVSTATSGRWVQDPQRNGKLRPHFFAWLHRVGGRTMQPMVPTAEGEPLIDWSQVFSHRPYKDVDRALGRMNTAWRDWLAHADDSDYWRELSAFHSFSRITIPVLHVTGTYDGSAEGQLESFERMISDSVASDKQYLIMGPWDHAGTRKPQAELRGLEFGSEAVVDVRAIHLRWFDYWLKGVENGQGEEPRVRLFTMGRNRWRDEPSWPVPGTSEWPYYLAPEGRLSPTPPRSDGSDTYAYDPNDPTPSAPDMSTFLVSDAPLEHSYAERRADVLVYTSEPLETELEVTGTPHVLLYAASDAVDTDFAAVLTDVHPDGRSMLVAEGLVRASFRSGRGPALPTPGQIYEYSIRLNPTSIAFLPGHRIRLCIMSAEFPAYDRNPNTGARIGEDEQVVVAHQTVFRTSTCPSALVLPAVAPSGHS
jgi:uncharacterized protein